MDFAIATPLAPTLSPPLSPPLSDTAKDQGYSGALPNLTQPSLTKPNETKHIKRFVKPSVEDVAAYCEERKNGVDAEAFVDFYESKGWKVGNQKMKDWKASVRTWEKNSNPKPHTIEERDGL